MITTRPDRLAAAFAQAEALSLRGLPADRAAPVAVRIRSLTPFPDTLFRMSAHA